MDDWDNDRMKDSFAYSGDDQITAFEKFRADFALKDKPGRIADLKIVDQWLGDDVRPTKSYASIWIKRRDLVGLHNDLLRLGR